MGRYPLSTKLLFGEFGEGALHRDQSPFPITRRSFIIGSGVTYLASVTPAIADNVVVEKVGRGYRFNLGGESWLVDPDRFGGQASAVYRWVDATGRFHPNVPGGADGSVLIAHEIELKDAPFPGLSIRADFKARLYRRSDHWYVRIGFLAAGRTENEIPFADWVAADENGKYRDTYRGGTIIVGNVNNKENKIEVQRYPALFEADSRLKVTVSRQPKRGSIRFTSKRFQFGASGIKLHVSDRPGERVPDEAIGPFTLLSFEDARFRHGKAELGKVGKVLDSHIDYDDCHAGLIGFRLQRAAQAADALLRLSGDGALVVSGPGTGPIGARIQLERWRVVARANGLDHNARFAGWIARAHQAVEGNHSSVVIQGDGFSDTRLDLDVSFGEDSPSRIAFTTHLLAAHVPVRGASSAELIFHRRAVRVVLGTPESDKTSPASARRDALFQISGGQTLFDTRLDDADLRVKRSTDLLDLTFSFRRYVLNVVGAVSRLIRRESPPVAHEAKNDPWARSDRALLIVKFHPQYLLEEAFAVEGGTACPAPAVKPDDNKACHPEVDRTNLKDISDPGLAHTRLSGPSRIVFADNAPATPAGEFLSIDYLTDWSDLATVVNKRALPRNATLEDQLGVVGINPLTSRSDAKEMIVANTEAPGPEETAIEPIYRLLMSPDAAAKWATPREAPQSRAPIMWSAELANPKATAMRVLWSRDMDLGFLEQSGDDLRVPPPAFKSLPQDKFRASLNWDDRRQLAEMMSVYGIAAMRRLAVSNSINSTNPATVKDDPNGMVFLPTQTYCALDPTTKAYADDPSVTARQEGFVLARPFDETFRLKLSRAATMDGRWIGEPPAPWYDADNPNPNYPRFFKTAFTIEKYIHQTQDGRDTFVEVTYKGFLFPIGHRAALLKVTKREFWPEKNDPKGAPVAYLIQHRYIVVRKPDKTFPGYAQPYASRDFPAKKVTIKTVRTPDLADPEPIAALVPSGPIPTDTCRPLDGGGSVFWPQLPGSNPTKRLDALFEYAIDDGPIARSPLLFIDNAAAHDEPSMRAIVDYYVNKLPEPDLLKPEPDRNTECFLRFAKLFEAPRRYADETTSGECTFKTASWVLGARGRLSSVTSSVITISHADDNGSHLIQLTLSGLTAGPLDLHFQTTVTVEGVLGTTEANGTWEFTIIDPTHIVLKGSRFMNTYGSGGTIRGASAVQSFSMDAFMEGRDQPPFYPVVTKARITVDKVDRLTGAPNTAIEAAFDPNYVVHGFDPATNPAEIFLDVLQPDIQFDPAGNTSHTGGVATTNSLLVALARRSGLIGGTKASALPDALDCNHYPRNDGPHCPAVPAAPAAMLLGPAGPAPVAPPPASPPPLSAAPIPSKSPYNMTSALAGRFDPIEFFSGALKDAKLLGIVPLKDILRAVLIAAAPKLMEAAQYGASEATDAVLDALKNIIKVAKPAAGKLAAQVKTIEDSANSALQRLTGSASVTLAALYPEFATALDQTKKTASAIAALPDTVNDAQRADEIFGLATEFKSDVDAVLKELRRLASDPMPTVVQDQLKALQQAWEQVRNFVDHPDDWLKQLAEQLIDAVFEKICAQLIDAGLFEVVLGYLNDPAGAYDTYPQPTTDQLTQQCMRIMHNPAEVLPRLQQALFYEVFAQPFAAMLAGIQQLKEEAARELAWGRATLAAGIAAVLRRGVTEAQNNDLPVYAQTVLEDMQKAVPAIIVTRPLDQILTSVQQAARASVERQAAQLQGDIRTWYLKRKRKAEETLKQAKEQALKGIDDAAQAEYQRLMTKWALQDKLAGAYVELAAAYGGPPIDTKVPRPADISFRALTPQELDKIAGDLRAVAEQEIRSVVADFEAKVRERAKAAADGLAKRLLAIVTNVIDTAAHSAMAASIATIGKDIVGFCGTAAATTFDLIHKVTLDLYASSKEVTDFAARITQALEQITAQLNQLQIPDGAPQDAREVIIGLRASLTRTLQQLAGVLLEFERIRDAFTSLSNPVDAYCSDVKKLAGLLDLPARSVDLRRRAAQAIVDALTQITAALAALPRLAGASPPAPGGPSAPYLRSLDASTGDLTTSLGQLADALAGMIAKITSVSAIVSSDANWAVVTQAGQDLINKLNASSAPDAAKVVKDAFDKFDVSVSDPLKSIKVSFTAAGRYTPAIANDILQFAAANERQLIGALLQATLPAKLLNDVLTQAAQAVAVISDKLIEIHKTVNLAIGDVLGVITPSSGSAPLLNVLAKGTVGALQAAQAQVQADKGSLINIKTLASASPVDPSAFQAAAVKLRDDWSSNTPGLIQTFQVVKNVIDAIATGNFAALFNIADFEAALQQAVTDLIPTRVTLHYDFNTELGDFPSGDPIFAMDRENFSSYGPEATGEKARNDLDLRTQITVDLASGERKVTALGLIRPFRLHLLGNSLDLATIYFKGARFYAEPGSDFKFNAEIADAKIGAMLAFLQVLQNYLAPSGGNGFYRGIQLIPPQIEVGYRFSKDFLLVGGLIFQNIGFGVGAILPIDGRQAEFRFTFASRAKPFLISAPPPTPYGGGGFVGLRANARGVVAFEIQLEFGAIFAIEFGPLHADARITAGIYLLCQAGGGRVLEGFVQAVGEGNIACFSVSVLIQIKTTQQADSSMSGSSTYEFSFKVCSFEVKYSVTAGYRTEGSGGQSSGGGGGSAMLEAEEIITGAIASRTPAGKNGKKGPRPVPMVKRRVRTLVPRMQGEWDKYRTHVDI